tara:strand:- start:98 stop:436 length:339 start_codon:yes stop_codon:yes gene_type:complete
MSDNYDYTWIRDVGHGWLRVRKDEYLLTGFKATPYSYQDDKYVYLEEDVDAPTYLKLYQPNPKNIVEEFYNGQSPVRDMDRIEDLRPWPFNKNYSDMTDLVSFLENSGNGVE